MAGKMIRHDAPKRKRTKKRKSRTEVSSDSESESEVQQRKSRTSKSDEKTEAKDVQIREATEPSETHAKPVKEKKKKKTKTTTTTTTNAEIDTPMTDADQSTSVAEKLPAGGASDALKTKTDSPEPEEDFTSLYLRKITAELADDLDKVREASDFTSRSLPLLIHALKQGESTFSMEEKRRLVRSR